LAYEILDSCMIRDDATRFCQWMILVIIPWFPWLRRDWRNNRCNGRLTWLPRLPGLFARDGARKHSGKFFPKEMLQERGAGALSSESICLDSCSRLWKKRRLRFSIYVAQEAKGPGLYKPEKDCVCNNDVRVIYSRSVFCRSILDCTKTFLVFAKL